MKARVGIVLAGLVLAGCAGTDDEAAEEPEATQTEDVAEEPVAQPTLDLAEEVAAILSADPTLCGTEMTAVQRMVEDHMGTLIDEDEVSDLVLSECADVDPLAGAESELPESPSEYPVFGESYEWTDGISVTVSEPVEFTPSEYSAVEGATAHLRFTVTITNDTGAEFDPSMASETAQSGGWEAESVFDGENGIGGSPDGLLLDGRDVSYDVGFAVLDPADLVFEISPSFDHEPGIFISA